MRARGSPFGVFALLPGVGILFSGLAILSGAELPSADEIVRRAESPAGLCVLLGGGEGSLGEELAARGPWLVQELVSDSNEVASARSGLQRAGLYGQVTVEFWAERYLPYPDNLVNVVVASAPGEVSDEEIRRVLTPGGVAWIYRDGQWGVVEKTWPAIFDEWTHWRHGADGNMVSHDRAVRAPTGLRWVAGPAQDDGGRRWYYDHVLVSARGRNFYLLESELVARDAFNGLLLWRRALRPHTFRETGGPVPEFLQGKTRVGGRASKVRPVAGGDRLYVAADGMLQALDAATGRKIADLGPVNEPREILLENDLLVVSGQESLRAFRGSTGQLVWQAAGGAERVVAGGGRLFCLAEDRLTALDLASGGELWQVTNAAFVPATTCTYHQGYLALEMSSWRDDPEGCGLFVYAGEDGKLLWQKTYRPGMTHYRETRAFFAQDMLWLQLEQSRVVGYDPRTGEMGKVWRSRGLHCATPVATERYFIAPECEFTDLETGSQERARMFKSACRQPFIPANGLLYSFPVQCECFPMLRGYMGLAAEPPPVAGELAWTGRAGVPPSTSFPSREADPAQEWPLYRHDVYRSGSTPMKLGRAESAERWAASVVQPPRSALADEWRENPFVRGSVTPPVIASGRVVVALPDEHRVVALDADDGRALWSFTAGGRVDSPPSLYRDRCLFGAHDGWVYCLDARTGQQLWRLRAAPRPTRMTAYGQIESVWPVPGSLLIDQGIAYCAAGRHPKADGGIWVCALGAEDGRVLWRRAVDDLVLESWYAMLLPSTKGGRRSKVGVDFEPFDLLVRDGERVAMSRWRFHPLTGEFQLELASTDYEANGLAVPRGLWGYGIRQTKSVEEKLPAVFDQGGLRSGQAGQVALLLAGGTMVAANTSGELQIGEVKLRLPAAAVHDGLAAAYGRVYVATTDGRVVCLE